MCVVLFFVYSTSENNFLLCRWSLLLSTAFFGHCLHCDTLHSRQRTFADRIAGNINVAHHQNCTGMASLIPSLILSCTNSWSILEYFWTFLVVAGDFVHILELYNVSITVDIHSISTNYRLPTAFHMIRINDFLSNDCAPRDLSHVCSNRRQQ